MTKEEIKKEVLALYEEYNALTKLDAETKMKKGQFDDRVKALIQAMGFHDQFNIIELLKEFMND